jgi:hypothetical protein
MPSKELLLLRVVQKKNWDFIANVRSIEMEGLGARDPCLLDLPLDALEIVALHLATQDRYGCVDC